MQFVILRSGRSLIRRPRRCGIGAGAEGRVSGRVGRRGAGSFGADPLAGAMFARAVDGADLFHGTSGDRAPGGAGHGLATGYPDE